MSEVHPLVQEFRDTVDQVIATRVAEVEALPGRSIGPISYRVQQTLGEYSYLSADKGKGRSGYFGLSSEYMWAVAHPIQYSHKPGHLVVSSVMDKPESLTRRIYVRSAMQMIGASVVREFRDEETMAKAVQWATGSHLARSVMTELCELGIQERENLDSQLEHHAESRRQLSRDLEEIARTQRRAAANAHNYFLD